MRVTTEVETLMARERDWWITRSFSVVVVMASVEAMLGKARVEFGLVAGEDVGTLRVGAELTVVIVEDQLGRMDGYAVVLLDTNRTPRRLCH